MLSPGIILPQCPHQDHGDETNLNRESSLTHKDQEIKNFKLCCGQCDGAGAGLKVRFLLQFRRIRKWLRLLMNDGICQRLNRNFGSPQDKLHLIWFQPVLWSRSRLEPDFLAGTGAGEKAPAPGCCCLA